MVKKRIGNRAIPIVSISSVLVIIAILALTRHSGGGGDPLSNVAEGRKIYSLVCAACHHPDPTVDRLGGIFGPPIAGSSLELLRMRVRTKSYPEGYIPKRDTSLIRRCHEKAIQQLSLEDRCKISGLQATRASIRYQATALDRVPEQYNRKAAGASN